MPESLLTWFNRFTDDPKKLEARLNGRPVLLYEPPEAPPHQTGDDEDDDYQFRTQSGIAVPAIGGGEPLAVVVEKTKDNAFQRRVTVGRTSNNDIVLDDASVSRFHAWVQQEDGGGWSIVDAGSRNGTQVGGKKLAAKVPSALQSGVKVRIGVIELTFFSADGFVKMLKSRAG
ncbi:MAG: FHA domain-containing protein [Myxococcaceae bacterium]|nr:FHA domain-containing protein [Myxococcaceae bacterium]